MWWSTTSTHFLYTSRNADCTFSKYKAVPKSQTELLLQDYSPATGGWQGHAVSQTAKPVTFCPFSSPYLKAHGKCQCYFQQHSLYGLILQVVFCWSISLRAAGYKMLLRLSCLSKLGLMRKNPTQPSFSTLCSLCSCFFAPCALSGDMNHGTEGTV